jgi:hypothetical protein
MRNILILFAAQDVIAPTEERTAQCFKVYTLYRLSRLYEPFLAITFNSLSPAWANVLRRVAFFRDEYRFDKISGKLKAVCCIQKNTACVVGCLCSGWIELRYLHYQCYCSPAYFQL